MKLTRILSTFVFSIVCSTAFGQTSDLEWFITANGNLYIPRNNPDKGVYPILWIDKDTDPKLLIGGLGLGVSVFKPYREKVSWKGQANLSRHAYWDKPVLLTSNTADPIGYFTPGSVDLALGFTATAHYFLSKHFSVGTGLGAQLLLASSTRSLPSSYQFTGKQKLIANHYYKPLIPVLPLEASLKFNRVLLNVRYEHGLLNRFKGDLGRTQKDKFSLLTFEIGFKIR